MSHKCKDQIKPELEVIVFFLSSLKDTEFSSVSFEGSKGESESEIRPERRASDSLAFSRFSHVDF